MRQSFSFVPSRLVCCRKMDFILEDGKIVDVQFHGGCSGNLLGIAKLVSGKTPEEIIPLLEGIQCGGKPTSCPDQFAYALKEALKK